MTLHVDRGFLDPAGIIQCEKDGGDAELSFIKGPMCSKSEQNLILLLASIPEGITPISQKEGLKFSEK